MIDGGASHNVYYSAVIPEGAVEREVELAHGSKKGYILNDDITFLDESMSPEQGAVGFIISLGRFTSYGAKIFWDKKGAFLTMPGGKTVKLPMHNNCPHASPEIVRDFEALKARQYRKRQGEELLIKLATTHRAKLKSQIAERGILIILLTVRNVTREQRRRGHIRDSNLKWEES